MVGLTSTNGIRDLIHYERNLKMMGEGDTEKEEEQREK